MSESICFLSATERQRGNERATEIHARSAETSRRLMEADANPPYFQLSRWEGRVEIAVITKQLEGLLPVSGTSGQTAGQRGFFQACLLGFSLFVCLYFPIKLSLSHFLCEKHSSLGKINSPSPCLHQKINCLCGAHECMHVCTSSFSLCPSLFLYCPRLAVIQLFQ